MALLDTGAGKSCIDLTIARLFKLSESGKPQPVSGATSNGMFPQFAIDARIPLLDTPIPPRVLGLPLLRNNFAFPFIIGRDILCLYRMTVNGRTGLIQFVWA